MSGKIFLNYRRGDEPGFALALYGQLEHAFGAERLFMDVEGGIRAGDDFIHVLEEQVTSCDVLLALIGRGWLDATDEQGRRRLDNPDDFVRIEIESAMRRGKIVIPVLVNKAEMPRAEDLPETLRPITYRHGIRLTQERFKTDAHGLIKAVEAAVAEAMASRHVKTEAERFAVDRAARRKREELGRGAHEVRATGGQQSISNVSMGLWPSHWFKFSIFVLLAALAGVAAIILG